MEKIKKILHGDKDIINRKSEDFYLFIDLHRTAREFVPNKYDNVFNITDQYNKERNSCRNFRIYGQITSSDFDCTNLKLFVFKDIPNYSLYPHFSTDPNYLTETTTKPIVSNSWKYNNIFKKQVGKYLIEIDNFTETADTVYIHIIDINPNAKNLYKCKLVYNYTTTDIFGNEITKTIPYGTDGSVVDINGNIIEVNNDFDFFYNKHWIKKNIDIETYNNI